MANYADFVSRIATLDALLSGIDPNWQSSVSAGALGGLIGSGGQSVTGASAFAGILADVSNGAAVAADTITTTPSPYANTIYAGIRVMGGIAFSSPLPGGRLTQDFGPTSLAMEPAATVGGVHYAHYHPGIDLATKLGTPILAAANGTVIAAGRASDGAVIVKIRHADGYVTLYGHLNPALDVKVGDTVTRGQELGKEGLTGKTTGPHLHFGLYSPAGKAIDPTQYLTTGRLPDTASQVAMPASLASPASATDPGTTVMEPTSAVLARFDAVSSKIPYAAQIRSAAIAHGIDPLLLAALASNESSFHANSVSSAGAKGLTQLMPGVASAMGVTDPFDPQQNLNGGARYLALQLKRFGRIDRALAAYSKGPGTVWRAGGGVPASARAYVAKVLGKWSRYEESAS
jgi:hypothetical protein